MKRITTLTALLACLGLAGACGNEGGETAATPDNPPVEETTPTEPTEPEEPAEPEEPEEPAEEPEEQVQREDQTDLECENDDVDCPTYTWYEENLGEDVMSARDTEAIAIALHKVEFLAPVEAWNEGPTGWVQIARRGAIAAEAGDFDTARQACRQCHVLYPERGNSYRGQFRAGGFRTDPFPELPENAAEGVPDLEVLEAPEDEG